MKKREVDYHSRNYKFKYDIEWSHSDPTKSALSVCSLFSALTPFSVVIWNENSSNII